MGLFVLVTALAMIAGLCAFLIEYEQGSHRFPPAEARRRGLRTGAVASTFFLVLGYGLVVILLR